MVLDFLFSSNVRVRIEAMSRKQMGSSIDDFLKEEGTFEETQILAIKEVVEWQLGAAFKRQPKSESDGARPS